MDTIVYFDNFVNQCEYFYFHDKSPLSNNGYNCSHPKQEYREDKIGCCYSWACPFGHKAEKEDFEDKDIDNNGHEYSEGQFMVLYDKEELNEINEGVRN